MQKLRTKPISFITKQPRKENALQKKRVALIGDLLPANYIEYVLQIEKRWNTPEMIEHIKNVRQLRVASEPVTKALEIVAKEYQQSLDKLSQMNLFE